MLLVSWHEPPAIGGINHNALPQYCISRPNINHLHSHVVCIATLLSEIHLGLTLWFPIYQSWIAWAADDRYKILRFTFRCAKYLISAFRRLDWILGILFILGVFLAKGKKVVSVLNAATSCESPGEILLLNFFFFFFFFFDYDYFRGKFDNSLGNRKQSHTTMTQVMGLWDLHMQLRDRKSRSKFGQITQHVLLASKWPKTILQQVPKNWPVTAW